MKDVIFEASEIVSSVKSYERFVQNFYKPDRINFLGCSEMYCEEKIDSLIYTLQHLKKYLKNVDKSQKRQEKELAVINPPLTQS